MLAAWPAKKKLFQEKNKCCPLPGLSELVGYKAWMAIAAKSTLLIKERQDAETDEAFT